MSGGRGNGSACDCAVEVLPSEAAVLALTICGSLCAFAMLVSILCLVRNRERVMGASSLILLSIGGFSLCLSSIVFLGVADESASTCALRRWVTCLSVTLMCVPLMARMRRLAHMLGGHHQLRSPHHKNATTWHIGLGVMFQVGIGLIGEIADYVQASAPDATQSDKHGGGNGGCDDAPWFTWPTAIYLCLVALYTLHGAVATRNAPAAFNETSSVATAIAYAASQCLVVLGFNATLTGLSSGMREFVDATVVVASATLVAGIVVGPRLHGTFAARVHALPAIELPEQSMLHPQHWMVQQTPSPVPASRRAVQDANQRAPHGAAHGTSRGAAQAIAALASIPPVPATARVTRNLFAVANRGLARHASIGDRQGDAYENGRSGTHGATHGTTHGTTHNGTQGGTHAGTRGGTQGETQVRIRGGAGGDQFRGSQNDMHGEMQGDYCDSRDPDASVAHSHDDYSSVSTFKSGPHTPRLVPLRRRSVMDAIPFAMPQTPQIAAASDPVSRVSEFNLARRQSSASPGPAFPFTVAHVRVESESVPNAHSPLGPDVNSSDQAITSPLTSPLGSPT